MSESLVTTISTRIGELLETSLALTITTPEDYSIALSLWEDIKKVEKEIALVCDAAIKSAYEKHKEEKAKKDHLLAPLLKAKGIFKEKLEGFQELERRLLALKQAEAEAAARKQAEDDALRIAAEIEKGGDKETARQILDSPIAIPSPKVESSIPKVDGRTFGRHPWVGEVIDADKVPRELCSPDQSKINAYAKLREGQAAAAGVRFYQK